MGWVFYIAEHYKKDGSIDRKAECDSQFAFPRFKIEKSAMVGTTYYAAVRTLCSKAADGTLIPLPVTAQKVYPVIILTSTRRELYNFGYKDVPLEAGPRAEHCPVSVLNALSSFSGDEQYIEDWKIQCNEARRAKRDPNKLCNLPIGSVIRCKIRYLNEVKELEFQKVPPAYQFKRPFWYCAQENGYLKRTQIPADYVIVRR